MRSSSSILMRFPVLKTNSLSCAATTMWLRLLASSSSLEVWGEGGSPTLLGLAVRWAVWVVVVVAVVYAKD